MPTNVCTARVAGELLHLCPEFALYWPRRSTLMVADLHLGKAATFRAAAIPLPGGTTSHALERLSAALNRTGAERLIVLGDLFHAKSGRAPQTLDRISAWRRDHAHLDIVLVRGNHDVHAGDPPADWHFDCQDAPVVDAPFVYQHDPEPSPLGYVLAGHLHPAVLLNGKGRQVLRLPCFHFTETTGTLPAFGEFTGSATVRPAPADQVFVIADGAVIEMGTPTNS